MPGTSRMASGGKDSQMTARRREKEMTQIRSLNFTTLTKGQGNFIWSPEIWSKARTKSHTMTCR